MIMYTPPTPPLSPCLGPASVSQASPKRLRILALHGTFAVHGSGHATESSAANTILVGFGQSGDFFRAKLQRLITHLETTFSDRYPGGIDMVFPDGPVDLSSDTAIDVGMRAWWRTLDDTSLNPNGVIYPELPSSLASLAELLRADPVDGIIGFSQGACVAMMLTALCEGTLERSAALRKQGAPIDLISPPQAPFKFAIACCGFRGNPAYYSGFYEPEIKTPSLHLIGDWDTMVPPERSVTLAEECAKSKVVRHRGGHHVPTDTRHLNIMSEFVGDACATKACTSLPMARFLKESSARGAYNAKDGGLSDSDMPMAQDGKVEIASGLMTPPLSLKSVESKAPSRSRWQWTRARTVCRVRQRVRQLMR